MGIDIRCKQDKSPKQKTKKTLKQECQTVKVTTFQLRLNKQIAGKFKIFEFIKLIYFFFSFDD